MKTTYNIALSLHLVGVTTMAGAALYRWILLRTMHENQPGDQQIFLFQLMRQLSKLLAVGFVILLFSGSTMLYLVNGLFETQLWFQLKLALLLWLVIGGAIFQNRYEKRLLRLLTTPTSDFSLVVQKKVSQLLWWLQTDLLAFLVIFVLVIFKFN